MALIRINAWPCQAHPSVMPLPQAWPVFIWCSTYSCCHVSRRTNAVGSSKVPKPFCEVWVIQIIGQIISWVWDFNDGLGKWVWGKAMEQTSCSADRNCIKVLDLFALFLMESKTDLSMSRTLFKGHFIWGGWGKGGALLGQVQYLNVSCLKLFWNDRMGLRDRKGYKPWGKQNAQRWTNKHTAKGTLHGNAFSHASQ